ncbi:MAG: hypothetical protein AAGC55_01380 [Myxococcota bacterium]
MTIRIAFIATALTLSIGCAKSGDTSKEAVPSAAKPVAAQTENTQSDLAPRPDTTATEAEAAAADQPEQSKDVTVRWMLEKIQDPGAPDLMEHEIALSLTFPDGEVSVVRLPTEHGMCDVDAKSVRSKGAITTLECQGTAGAYTVTRVFHNHDKLKVKSWMDDSGLDETLVETVKRIELPKGATVKVAEPIRIEK